MTAADPELVPARIGIRVELISGEVLELDFDAREYFSADLLPQLPDLEQKFLSNASGALGETAAKRLQTAIAELAGAENALEALSDQ